MKTYKYDCPRHFCYQLKKFPGSDTDFCGCFWPCWRRSTLGCTLCKKPLKLFKKCTVRRFLVPGKNRVTQKSCIISLVKTQKKSAQNPLNLRIFLAKAIISAQIRISQVYLEPIQIPCICKARSSRGRISRGDS